VYLEHIQWVSMQVIYWADASYSSMILRKLTTMLQHRDPKLTTRDYTDYAAICSSNSLLKFPLTSRWMGGEVERGKGSGGTGEKGEREVRGGKNLPPLNFPSGYATGCLYCAPTIAGRGRITKQTRHRASTSMYSLIFRVRVTTPTVWTKWNGERSRRVDFIAGEGSLRRHA